jgi:hypothetical protein
MCGGKLVEKSICQCICIPESSSESSSGRGLSNGFDQSLLDLLTTNKPDQSANPVSDSVRRRPFLRRVVRDPYGNGKAIALLFGSAIIMVAYTLPMAYVEPEEPQS